MGENKDAVIERLKKLTKLGGGRLTPKAVVDDARNKKSPLHGHFEWNDGTAAEKYREVQARRLISSVRFEIIVEEVPRVVPYYVEDPRKNHGEQGYVEAESIASSEDLARDALAKEVQRVLSALERAEAVAIGLGLQGEVSELRSRVEFFMKKIAA